MSLTPSLNHGLTTIENHNTLIVSQLLFCVVFNLAIKRLGSCIANWTLQPHPRPRSRPSSSPRSLGFGLIQFNSDSWMADKCLWDREIQKLRAAKGEHAVSVNGCGSAGCASGKTPVERSNRKMRSEGYLVLPMILSMMRAMAPSPVTLQAVPKLSMAM